MFAVCYAKLRVPVQSHSQILGNTPYNNKSIASYEKLQRCPIVLRVTLVTKRGASRMEGRPPDMEGNFKCMYVLRKQGSKQAVAENM
jgi:hypothetical protein